MSVPADWLDLRNLKPPEPEFMFWYNCAGQLIKIPLTDQLLRQDHVYYMGTVHLKPTPWHHRGLAGRIGSTPMPLCIEAVLMRAVNIIAHMIGFWRDRQERRLLRVGLLDRNRKGRTLWTQSAE